MTLRTATPADAGRLAELDQQANGMWRPWPIDTLIADAQTVILQDARQVFYGFASLRRFGHGWAIGPVIALNLSVAQALVSALMQGLNGEFVRIDTDGAQPLAAWLETVGLVQVDAPVTMVRGNAVVTAARRYAGIWINDAGDGLSHIVDKFDPVRSAYWPRRLAQHAPDI